MMVRSALRPFRHLAPTVATIVVGCASLHPAQTGPSPFCIAPQAGAEAASTSWHLSGAAALTDRSVSPATASRALAGIWDLVAITTEGAAPAEVARWPLRLVQTDTGVWYQCALGPCPNRRAAFVAAGAPLRRSVTFDSVAASQRRSTDPERIDVRYDSTTNHLTLWPGAVILDAGTFYAVTEVSDTLLAGRWTDGSYVIAEVSRAGIKTLEHQQGFFCARRLGR
jgi:hypothetical protein